MGIGQRYGLVACILTTIVAMYGPCREAQACLAEYRSIDWQIARSRLVVLAEVIAIERDDEQKDRRRRLAGGDHAEPTIATLRILRVFKGAYEHAEVRVRSGPIRSCAPYEVHAKFSVGHRAIYILPGFPSDGVARLVWGGSVREATETGLVESTLARLQAYRENYLDQLRRGSPDTLKSANDLYDAMRKEFSVWPAATATIQPHSERMEAETFSVNESENVADAERKLSATLKGRDLEAIRAAMALDWLSNDPVPWSRHPVWRAAVDRVVTARGKELEKIERQRILKLLEVAGLDKAKAKTLLDSGERPGRNETFEFPPPTPNFLKTDITTDFIVRYFAPDRGMMVPAYAPNFSADILAGLDPERAKPYVAALYGCDDERLRWLACQAIAYGSSTQYSEILLEDVVEHGHVNAWGVLTHSKSPKLVQEKLSAMVEYGLKHYSEWGVDNMWNALRQGACFHPTVVERAIAFVEEREANGKGDDDNQNPAIHRYLAAAIATVDAKPPSQRTAGEYRAWLVANRKRLSKAQDNDDEDLAKENEESVEPTVEPEPTKEEPRIPTRPVPRPGKK